MKNKSPRIELGLDVDDHISAQKKLIVENIKRLICLP